MAFWRGHNFGLEGFGSLLVMPEVPTPAIESCPQPTPAAIPASWKVQTGVCASLLAPWAANVRGDPAKEKRKEASSVLGELAVSSEQRGFSLLEVSAAAKEGKKSSLYTVFIHK